jgi:hypothetical protein
MELSANLTLNSKRRDPFTIDYFDNEFSDRYEKKD